MLGSFRIGLHFRSSTLQPVIALHQDWVTSVGFTIWYKTELLERSRFNELSKPNTPQFQGFDLSLGDSLSSRAASQLYSVLDSMCGTIWVAFVTAQQKNSRTWISSLKRRRRNPTSWPTGYRSVVTARLFNHDEASTVEVPFAPILDVEPTMIEIMKQLYTEEVSWSQPRLRERRARTST